MSERRKRGCRQNTASVCAASQQNAATDVGERLRDRQAKGDDGGKEKRGKTPDEEHSKRAKATTEHRHEYA